MVKVLIVCTVPTDKSGIPNVIFNLMQAMNGFELQIGYVSINEPSEFYRQKLASAGAKLYVIQRKMSNPLGYIKQLSKVSEEYDIMHVHGNSATMVLEMIAAKLAGVKLRIAHSHNTSCSKRIIDRLARPLFHTLCNGRMACGIEAGKWLFGKRSFMVLNNGIKTDKFRFSSQKRSELRKQLIESCNNAQLDDCHIIGHIGNFLEVKNHLFLIKVFNEYHRDYPKSRLLLLGAGPTIEEAKKLVADLNIADYVIFAGSVDNPEDCMNAMDIIAMPSLYEGLPLTMIEEQANGLHVLASKNITRDANLSGNVKYLPISELDIKLWKECLEKELSLNYNREKESEFSISKIKKNDFDIQCVAKQLYNYYVNRLIRF